jgi:CRISPR/Cas system-associated protein Cas7 (RAMP superfamily)
VHPYWGEGDRCKVELNDVNKNIANLYHGLDLVDKQSYQRYKNLLDILMELLKVSPVKL